MRWLRKHRLQVVTHAVLLAPGLWLLLDAVRGRLGVDPVQAVQVRTGRLAITLLVLTLAVTPLHRLLHRDWLPRSRRPLGLYAFAYACVHLFNFVVLDYRLDLTLLWADVAGKRFIFVGLGAILLLAALAVTSTAGWQRRLGRGWKGLQRLVYVAAPLAVAHFAWAAKVDLRLPLIYGAVVLALLVARLPVVAETLERVPGRKTPDTPAPGD